MNFCHHCGEELGKDLKFCNHCGKKVAAQQAENGQAAQAEQKEKSPVQQQQPVQQQKAKSPLSNQTKLLLALAGALIVILFIGFKIGASMTSYEKLVTKFETALIEEDAKSVAKMISTDSQNLTIDEQSVAGFIAYYKERPSELDSLIQYLKYQGDQIDLKPELRDNDGYYYAVNLIEDGKKMLFFKGYAIKVSPVYFNVYTNYENTDIFLDGEKIETANTDDFYKEIGPYLPGVYTFKAVYESDFIDLEIEDNYTNFDPGYTEEVYLYLDGEDVTFEIPYSEDIVESIVLYINEKDVGINLLEQNTIGPVLIDGSMTVAFEAEFPWGKMKSGNIPIHANYMEAFIPPNKDLQGTAKDAIIQFNEEYIQAYTQADLDLMTNATENFSSQVEYKIEQDERWDDYYQGKFIGINFYDEAFSLSRSENRWKLDVGTDTLHEETQFSKYSSPDLSLSEEDVSYELIYDEESGKWFVDRYGYYGYFTKETVDEYRTEDPKLYTTVWAEEYLKELETEEEE